MDGWERDRPAAPVLDGPSRRRIWSEPYPSDRSEGPCPSWTSRLPHLLRASALASPTRHPPGRPAERLACSGWRWCRASSTCSGRRSSSAGDSAQYFQPVYDLINTGRFTLSLKRPPLYPWMLYVEQVLFGPSFVPMIAFQHLLGAIGVVLTYWIGRLAWDGSQPSPPDPLSLPRERGSSDVALGRWAGSLAALLVAFSSPTLRWEHFLMTEGPFAFLFTLVMFLIVLGLRRRGVDVAVGRRRLRPRPGDPDALGGAGRLLGRAADGAAGRAILAGSPLEVRR